MLSDKVTPKVAKVFDKLRNGKVFNPSDTLTLLKADVNEREYAEVLEVSGSWYLSYDKFRKSPKLSIADTSEDITIAMAEATHFRINDNVYVIDDGGKLAPIGGSIMWTVFGERDAKRSNHVELW
ncbi:MAG: hypothetical protein LC734_02050 [Acidobacteria bacterium]|nr:hypothetical protein [Acidobacteriota bacterium]